MRKINRVDFKVIIVWMVPYIIAILLSWLILSLIYYFSIQLAVVVTKNIMLDSFCILIALIILIGIPSFVWSYFQYITLTYEIAEQNFIISQGVLSRRKTVIPYDTLEDIGFKHSLFERLIGLSTLELDTAGGANIEGVLPGISNPDEIIETVKVKMHGKRHFTERSKDEDVLKEILKELRIIRKATVKDNNVDDSNSDNENKNEQQNIHKIIKDKFNYKGKEDN